VGIYQVGEVFLEIICGQPIRAAVEILGDPTKGTRINIDGAFALTLPMQCVNMLSVQ
jgi:hypothetical protein